MVQPAAITGTTLSAIWLIGPFQYVIRPLTSIGSRANFSGAPISHGIAPPAHVVAAFVVPGKDRLQCALGATSGRSSLAPYR